MYVLWRGMEGHLSAVSGTSPIPTVSSGIVEESIESLFQLARRDRISMSQFALKFNRIGESEVLLHFRFRNKT